MTRRRDSKGKPFSFGRTRTRIDVDGLILAETIHTPNQRLRSHRHDLANVLFLLKGRFNENINGRTETCEPLSLFIRPAEEPHSNEYDATGTQCLIVGIKNEWRTLGTPLTDVLSRPSLNRSAAIAGLGIKLRREMILADSASTLSIDGILLELLAQAMRGSTSRRDHGRPRWLDRAVDLLHAHVSDDLDIATIASEAGVHSVHLARSFRKFYGCSIGEYVRRLRIEFAQTKLATTDMLLVDIALAAGFCTQSHFSTTFKRYVGLTPAEYRSALRQDQGTPKRSL